MGLSDKKPNVTADKTYKTYKFKALFTNIAFKTRFSKF